MQHTIKKLPKSTLEITVELSPEDMESYLQKGATNLSQQTSIPGFRPGKAPYDQVVARFGNGRVWEEAAQLAVPRAFGEIVQNEKLETIGSPTIEVIIATAPITRGRRMMSSLISGGATRDPRSIAATEVTA